MSNKYNMIFTDIISRFSSDKDIDESARSILGQVLNAEISKSNLKNPSGIKKEIREIIDKEARKNNTGK